MSLDEDIFGFGLATILATFFQIRVNFFSGHPGWDSHLVALTTELNEANIINILQTKLACFKSYKFEQIRYSLSSLWQLPTW